MKPIWSFAIFLGIVCVPRASVGIAPKGHPKETKTHSVEKSLIRMLLNRYEQYGVIGRPVNDSKIQVNVEYGLQLFQILDLDENKQILRTNCWSMYICMLEFGSWTYDTDQMDINWWRGQPPSEPMPYVDFSDYVPSNEWRTDGEADVRLGNGVKKRQIRSVKKYRFRTQTIGNETVTRKFPVLRYLIRLRRNPYFHVLMLVIPSVLLSSLTLVVFWLPPESPAKMMLGMNIFVAFFVLLLLLAESTPSAVRNFPLIGIYFSLNMVMITLSTFLATLVIHLYFRGDRNGAVPAVLRRLIIDGIGRLVFVRQDIPLPDVKKSASQGVRKEMGSSAKLRRKPHLSDQVGNQFMVNEMWLGPNGPRAAVGASRYPTGYPLYADSMFDGRIGLPFGSYGFPPTRVKHRLDPSDPSFTQARMCSESYGVLPPGQPDEIDQSNKPSTGFRSMNRRASFEDGTTHMEEAPDFISSAATLESDVREVKRYVKMFVNHKKDIQRKGLIAMEWRTLAIVLDRLFFFLYIATIGIAVIVSVPKSTEPELSDEFRE
ncbi:uncharacterized protein DEA37_0008606 [Paragonimus westermani]|uniref:Uncharacterized protein n=1 Tax=Paragonimus westermani TaxID=34504 RepID=A0A5J4P2C2_9TREM|nr:uncharacterized protein DEA37_0008606 [Paragonimus westermani]